MELSRSLPICGSLARPWRKDQRASGGTQKTFSAKYSSRSSGSAPFSCFSAACFSSKASEMYLRKIRPRTTCLVFRGVEVAAQLVCRGPERRLEAKRGAVGGFFLSSFDICHFASGISCADNSNGKTVCLSRGSLPPPRSRRSGNGPGRRFELALENFANQSRIRLALA